MPKLLIEQKDAVTLLTLNRPEVHDNVDDEGARDEPPRYRS